MHGPSGDWVQIAGDGALHIDVRLLLRTDDGADILMTYRGVSVDGGATIRAAPRFETGDPSVRLVERAAGRGDRAAPAAARSRTSVYGLR